MSGSQWGGLCQVEVSLTILKTGDTRKTEPDRSECRVCPRLKRSDRFTRNSHKSAPGWRKCGKCSTTCCPYALPPTNQVTGLVSGYNHKISDAVDCATENCVYYWRCKKFNCKAYPKCEYVGLTRRAFKTRIGEPKQNVRSRNLETPSGFHFNQPGHFARLVLEKVKSSNPFVLRVREFLHIQKFDGYRNRLNKEP